MWFFPAWIIILLSVLSLFIRTDKSMLQLFIVLLIILVSVFIISNSLNIIFPNSKLINSFQIDRFYFLYPALCFILLGVALSYWLDNYPVITVVFCLILGTQILKNDALLTNNIRFLMGDKTPVSYREFFDKQLFDSIKDEIDYSSDTDKVVCVGFYPSIAEYNGFYTLDGYANMYPLSYKHLFKQVIQQELDKSEWLNNYFTKWGNRCYIFSAELKDRDNMYMSSKEEHYPINQLDIDTEILKQLGCRYIFSAVDIDNFDSINLDYIDCFTTDESYWAIRVYRL